MQNKASKNLWSNLDNQQNKQTPQNPQNTQAQSQKLTGWDDQKPLLQYNLNTYAQRLNKMKQNQQIKKNKIVNYIEENKFLGIYNGNLENRRGRCSRGRARGRNYSSAAANNGAVGQNVGSFPRRNIEGSVKLYLQNSMENNREYYCQGENSGIIGISNNNIYNNNIANQLHIIQTPTNPLNIHNQNLSNNSQLQSKTKTRLNTATATSTTATYLTTTTTNFQNKNSTPPNPSLNSFIHKSTPHQKCQFSNIQLLKFQAKHLQNDQVTNNRFPSFNFSLGCNRNTGSSNWNVSCGNGNVNGAVFECGSVKQCQHCHHNNILYQDQQNTYKSQPYHPYHQNSCCHSSSYNYNNPIYIPNSQNEPEYQSTQLNIHDLNLNRKLRTQSTKRSKNRKEKTFSQMHASHINHMANISQFVNNNNPNNMNNNNNNNNGNKFYKTLTNQWTQSKCLNKNKANINLIVQPVSKVLVSNNNITNLSNVNANVNASVNGYSNGNNYGQSNLISCHSGTYTNTNTNMSVNNKINMPTTPTPRIQNNPLEKKQAIYQIFSRKTQLTQQKYIRTCQHSYRTRYYLEWVHSQFSIQWQCEYKQKLPKASRRQETVSVAYPQQASYRIGVILRICLLF